MAFETEGIVYKIFDTENKTPSFQAREFVIKQDGDYPQFIKFQLTQDRCDLIQNFEEGQKIKVHFDLRGREWNEKFFTNLNAWRLERIEQTSETEDKPDGKDGFNPLPQDFEQADSGSDLNAEDFGDLPF